MDSLGGENSRFEDRDIAQSKADIARAREMIRAMKAQKAATQAESEANDEQETRSKRIRSFEDITRANVIDASWESSPTDEPKAAEIEDKSFEPEQSQSPASDAVQTQAPEPEKTELINSDIDTHDSVTFEPSLAGLSEDDDLPTASDQEDNIAELEKHLRAIGMAEDEDDFEKEHQVETDAGFSSADAFMQAVSQDMPGDAHTADSVPQAPSMQAEQDLDEKKTTVEECQTEQAKHDRIPQFNLANQILAQQRKQASARRAAPVRQRPVKKSRANGTLAKVIEKNKLDTVRPNRPAEEKKINQDERSCNVTDACPSGFPVSSRSKAQLSAPVLRIMHHKRGLNQIQQKIIASIVERDIEKMCGQTGPRCSFSCLN